MLGDIERCCDYDSSEGNAHKEAGQELSWIFCEADGMLT